MGGMRLIFFSQILCQFFFFLSYFFYFFLSFFFFLINLLYKDDDDDAFNFNSTKKSVHSKFYLHFKFVFTSFVSHGNEFSFHQNPENAQNWIEKQDKDSTFIVIHLCWIITLILYSFLFEFVLYNNFTVDALKIAQKITRYGKKKL